MTRKQRRLTLIGAAGSVLTIAASLVLYALSGKIAHFVTPADLVAKPLIGQQIRLGGLVRGGSVDRSGGTTVRFVVEDAIGAVKVTYMGILPDLFREGQGVVTEGKIGEDGVFVAETVLAKHDENYMPKEVADKLKEQGYWKTGGEAGKPAGGPARP